jgi:hypothetical protein
MSSKPGSEDGEVTERNQRILRCFSISAFLLVIPVGELLWTRSLIIREAHIPDMIWVLDVLWLGTAIAGLIYGFRALRLADRKTNGFGILAVVLHMGSLIVLSMVACLRYIPNL